MLTINPQSRFWRNLTFGVWQLLIAAYLSWLFRSWLVGVICTVAGTIAMNIWALARGGANPLEADKLAARTMRKLVPWLLIVVVLMASAIGLLLAGFPKAFVPLFIAGPVLGLVGLLWAMFSK